MVLLGLFAFGIIVFSLGMGVAGYHYFEHLSWLDSLLNASMIMTGMGPVDVLHRQSSKLFASFYSLYSGIVFLSTVALLLAPIAHRFLHFFHIESDD
jgi:putative effector of murein hydrolase